jgi:hypothetical protein
VTETYLTLSDEINQLIHVHDHSSQSSVEYKQAVICLKPSMSARRLQVERTYKDRQRIFGKKAGFGKQKAEKG